MMNFPAERPDGLTFIVRSPDDVLKKVAWESSQYSRLASSAPQDWQGMVYMFINSCITLTSLVDWYAKALGVKERALSQEAEEAVDGFAICKAIANTTKHGSYRSTKNPMASVGLFRIMSSAEMALDIEELIKINDSPSDDWQVSVQTGKGHFSGVDFLEHIASGLRAFGRQNGLTIA